ncbi:Cys-rich peptide radical SAM maturase CcpM [Bariatricus sp. SGI.154]|uniref:Cys-rich peptide radical SAM maturase CcpM n=1 Tax=Bariatricus sp. SGI.154 TaxID=3420549 RepID=UPI003D0193F8
MKNDTPFIHLFKTPLGYYLYDINTEKVLKVDHMVYEYLENPGKNVDEDTIQKIAQMKKEGYLKPDRVKVTEHPYTEFFPYALQSKIGNMVLQVTQNCNLRCEYCIYSGNYKTRGHSHKRMSFETAKKAIDFFIDHSREQNELFLGFYGGEPLLEFELIKKCVDYIENIGDGKRIKYVITTNATLLTDEIIDYFVEHQFMITVSVDGPREIHNRSRIFANKNEGSYDVMIDNIKKIKKKSLYYYKEYVRFNTVMLTEDGFSCVDDYFRGDELFSDSFFSMSTVSTSYAKKEGKVSERFIQEQQYELFKTFLAKMGRLDKKHVSILLNRSFDHLRKMEMTKVDRDKLPDKWHRGGPCIPGVTRVFVTVEGNLLPCEKVCEISDIAKIGSLDKGFDLAKADQMLNVERFTEDICQNCWAYTGCSSCIRYCDNNEGNICQNMLKGCEQIKSALENSQKDCVVLKELGYDFELDTVIGNPENIFSEELLNV